MTNQPIQTIDVHELKRLLDHNVKLCLIDVRTSEEWQEVHIPNAIHLPKDELINSIATHVPDLEQPIYLHCKAGIRSFDAAQKLQEMGYKHVYSVNGGIIDWIQHNYPIIQQ
ncbi:Rhodanese domain protein [Legionella busanensis]|uniref:Rhodanese domain protein n=1 Tax=Legionella busanensis TaxID=190655 RepID=A0A378JPZ4_9GAMM|nr:rhodanese-like domain-containing protein [Legionella busanensis]STX52259.1 Rhodanese domain protein [Legionella busanensis]